jgi:hypothetical protein
MARLEVPLAYRRLRTTGDVVVHAELIMAIKTDRGTWELFPFLIDSGTEMTTMASTAHCSRVGLIWATCAEELQKSLDQHS